MKKMKWYQRLGMNLFFRMEKLTLNNAGRWLADLLSPGFQSYTGKQVSVQSALTNTSVWASVRLISETIASVPLEMFKRDGNDGKKKAKDHPLYYLLHTQPNSEMTAFSFWEMAFYHVLLTNGNFYAEIEKSVKGDVIALWPLLPDKMSVTRVGGEITYIYESPDGKKVQIPNTRVFHFHGPSLNGLTGLTPIALAKEAVGLGLAAEEFGARFFGNGGNVNGVLESDDELGEIGRKNLRESFEETYKGLSRAHRLLILEQGLKYKQTGIPPDQAQFLETRRFQVTEIARFFRVPPHMIYDLDRATYSNIEQQSLEFVKYTLLPWIIRVEQTISWKLLTDNEKKRYFAEFNLEGLLRGDLQSRVEAYHTMRMDGVITANEIRAKENMNPLTPEQLAETWRPVNMVPGDTPVESLHQLTLYGDISDTSWWGDEVTPKQMSDDLANLGDVEEINVRINSGGGDVFAGVAIHSMLKRHQASVTVYIDGLAASIASIIAMAGDKIIMPKGSMMMIHNPWSWTGGDANDFRKMADTLDAIRDSMIPIYADKTGMSNEEIIALLDAETWLSAEEAVEMGFATEVEDNLKVSASVKGKTATINGIEVNLDKFLNAPLKTRDPEPQKPQNATPKQQHQGRNLDLELKALALIDITNKRMV